jgi:molybdopterin synthase sulfur carrier subunit
MTVNLYATLRQLAGSRQVEVQLPPGSTLNQLIAELTVRYPGLRSEMLDPDGNLYQHIHVFVNGRDSLFLDGSLNLVLASGDTISIFPPVGGG